MEGYSTSDAIACSCPSPPSTSPSIPTATNPTIKNDPDGTVWINSTKYNLAAETEKASIAEADVEPAMTTTDLGEYTDWAVSNNDNWGDTEPFDTAMFYLATMDTALLVRENPPLYLDSGASAHILCIQSHFTNLTTIEPWTIIGVDSSVAAIELGTIEISLPGTSTCITLHKVLYTPGARVHLISISLLRQLRIQA